MFSCELGHSKVTHVRCFLGTLACVCGLFIRIDLSTFLLVFTITNIDIWLFGFFLRLVASEHRPALAAEPIVWQLVRLLASYDDPSLKSKIAKLAKTLVEWQPDFRRQLMTKRKALEQAVQGTVYNINK